LLRATGCGTMSNGSNPVGCALCFHCCGGL
jgi:hypothetical protein